MKGASQLRLSPIIAFPSEKSASFTNDLPHLRPQGYPTRRHQSSQERSYPHEIANDQNQTLQGLDSNGPILKLAEHKPKEG
jgi:hypothetical protein